MTDQTVAPENDRMLTQTELAERWSVTKRTLNNWRREGKGPSFVVIGNLRYPLSAVVAWEQENLTQGAVKLRKDNLEGARELGTASKKAKKTTK